MPTSKQRKRSSSTGKENNPQSFKVVVVGGGLVGALAALYFAQKGCQVHVFESRPDIRKDTKVSGRSINLALSTRGITSLERAGVLDSIPLLPMHSRMIHMLNRNKGSLKTSTTLVEQPYGVYGECINSVDRKHLNQTLLSKADDLDCVSLYFEHRLENADFDAKTVTFVSSKRKDGSNSGTEHQNEVVVKNVDLVLGCDGAYSKARQILMRKVRMDFSQTYIDHGYVELSMPPGPDGEYLMSPKHLHIWPKQTFMMIALPNQDKSFTVTLFMPFSKFDAIRNEKDLVDFFNETFPDSLPLLGIQGLVNDFFKNEKGSLVTVRCSPYNYKGKCVILGDAAHAMVPFYGQGMNCGFEDVYVLNEIWERVISASAVSGSTEDDGSPKFPSPRQLEEILTTYSQTRIPDAHAICDLAMDNYIEMRSLVTSPVFLLRKKVEGFLYKLFPKIVVPLYTMVSFSRIPYSEARRRDKRQGFWFDIGYALYKTVKVGLVCGVIFYGIRRTKCFDRVLRS